jgi:hypothetical protein
MMSERTLRAVIVTAGLFQVGQSVWMIASPGSFYDAIAGFGAQNDHYIRDVATFGLAAGAVLLAAVARPSWRVPALVLAALWYAAHAVNHLADIGEADPDWVGPFDFAALAVGAVLFALLAYGVATGRAGETTPES